MVVVVESIESLSTRSTHEQWESVLLDAGYRFAAFDGINRFYVDLGHEELAPILDYPMSPLDGFVTAASHDLANQTREEVARSGEPAAEPRRRLSVTHLAPRPRPRDGHAFHPDSARTSSEARVAVTRVATTSPEVQGVTPVAACRLCGGSDLVTVLDLGEQALTGVFPHSLEEDVSRVTSSSCCGARRARSFSWRTATSPPRCTATNYGYRSGLNESMCRSPGSRRRDVWNS